MMRFWTKQLTRLPPEVAHRLVIVLLRFWQFVTFKIRKKVIAPGTVVIGKLPHLRFQSRLGVAGGFDKNAEVFAAMAKLGFGFVEIGTVTPLPQSGNPKPRVWRVDRDGLVNWLGFNSVGAQRVRKNLLNYRGSVSVPIFANVGKNRNTPIEGAIEDYRSVLTLLADVVDGFVINVSSPNTPGLRQLQSEDFLEKLAVLIPDKPVWLKLSPDLDKNRFEDLVEYVKRSRYSGVVLTNTSEAMAKQAGFERGGLSGPRLFNRALDFVGTAAGIFKAEKTIVAVGGIDSGSRARQMIQAGADLVEVFTGFVYRGPELIWEIRRELGEMG